MITESENWFQKCFNCVSVIVYWLKCYDKVDLLELFWSFWWCNVKIYQIPAPAYASSAQPISHPAVVALLVVVFCPFLSPQSSSSDGRIAILVKREGEGRRRGGICGRLFLSEEAFLGSVCLIQYSNPMGFSCREAGAVCRLMELVHAKAHSQSMAISSQIR